MSQNNRFLRAFFSATLGVSCVASLINFVIDPYVFFGTNTLGAYFRTEKKFKFSKVNSYQHNAILIGSSVTRGINPDELDYYNFFNASFSQAVPEEKLFFLKNKAHSNLKMVIISLDILTLNERYHGYQETGKTYFHSSLEHLLSVKLLGESKKTVFNFLKNRPVNIFKNGLYNQTIENQRSASLKKPNYFNKYKKANPITMSRAVSTFSYSKNRMKALFQIKQFLEKKGIPYIVFFHPINRQVLEPFRMMPSYSEYLKVKKELNDLFPLFFDLSESKYAQEKYFFNHDIIHSTPAAGNKMINEMLKKYHEANYKKIANPI